FTLFVSSGPVVFPGVVAAASSSGEASLTAAGECSSKMIVFDLKCRKDHVFEAWFPDSASFAEQAAAGKVACPVCGSRKVSKALMAPNVVKTKGRVPAAPRSRGGAEGPSAAGTVAVAENAKAVELRRML